MTKPNFGKEESFMARIEWPYDSDVASERVQVGQEARSLPIFGKALCVKVSKN